MDVHLWGSEADTHMDVEADQLAATYSECDCPELRVWWAAAQAQQAQVAKHQQAQERHSQLGRAPPAASTLRMPFGNLPTVLGKREPQDTAHPSKRERGPT